DWQVEISLRAHGGNKVTCCASHGQWPVREKLAVEVKLVNSVAVNSVAVNSVAVNSAAFGDGAASRELNLPFDSTVNDNRLDLLRRNQCDSGKRYENRP